MRRHMTPQNKIRIANVTMLIGVLPLMLAIWWVCTGLIYAQDHKGQMGGSDAFAMIFVLIVAYAFACMVGAPSAHWSARLVKQAGVLPAPVSKVLRSLVLFLLVAPLVGYLLLFIAPVFV